MIEIGRIYVKIAGREAGKLCTIVEILDKNYCVIDGQVRRKRCNTKHLEPTAKTVSIKEKASHEAVASEFKKLGLDLGTTKPKKAGKRPVRLKQQKAYETPLEPKAKKGEGKKEPKIEVAEEPAKEPLKAPAPEHKEAAKKPAAKPVAHKAPVAKAKAAPAKKKAKK